MAWFCSRQEPEKEWEAKDKQEQRMGASPSITFMYIYIYNIIICNNIYSFITQFARIYRGFWMDSGWI